MNGIWRQLVAAIPLVIGLAAWELSASRSARARFLFASPSTVIAAGVSEISQVGIWTDIAYTGLTAATGLAIGWSLGSFIGLSLWSVPGFAHVSRPYLGALSAVPIFALAPVIIIWFGVGFTPKVLMAAFPVFLGCTTTAFWAAADADAVHREWMSGLGLSRRTRVFRVIVPEVFATLLEHLRFSVGAALVGTFIGEFIVSQRGLGRFILRASGVYDMPRVFLGILLLVALSAGFMALARGIASVGLRPRTAGQKRFD